MAPALHNLHPGVEGGDIQGGRPLADTAAVHLHNHAAGDAPSGQPAVVGVGAVAQGGVVGELLTGVQNGAVHLGQGQGHVAVAVGRVGGNRAVAGQLDEMLLQIGLGDGGLGLHKGGLDVPAPLLGEQLPHAFQGLGQIHLAAHLLVGKGEGAVLGPAGNSGVLRLGGAGLGRGQQLVFPGLGQVHHIVQGRVRGQALLQQLGQRQLQHVLGGEVLPGEHHGVVPELHGNLHAVYGLVNGGQGDFQGLVHGFAGDVLPADGGPFWEQAHILHLGDQRGGLLLLGGTGAKAPY